MVQNTFRGVNRIFFFLGLLLLPVLCFAQRFESQKVTDHHYVVEREFTTENGLPANGVNSIYQDRKGYIWAATYNGLVRYNGSDFKVFNTTNLKNLQSNRFITVSEDQEGRIWAGLEYSNFIMIDEKRDTTITWLIDQEEFRTTAQTSVITFDSKNTPWIGTSRGLITIQNGEIVYFNHLPDTEVTQIIHKENYTYALFEKDLIRLTSDGSIDKIIAELRNDVIYFENSSVDELDNVVRFMDFHFINGDLYLMSEAGLIRYDNNEPEIVFTRQEVEQAALYGFLPRGNQLYVYGRNGVFVTSLINQNFNYYTRTNVIEVQLDHEESLWAATNSNGVRQYVSTPIYQGETFNVLNEQGITGILKSKSGSVFVGANCGGIYEFNGDFVRQYGSGNGFENVCIWSLFEQADGTLWAGTWGGGVYYKPPGYTTFERFTPKQFEGVNVFLSIQEDSGGNLWFGTYYNGLYRFDGNQTEAITNTDGEKLTAVRMIYESSDGDMYVATDQGIGVLSENKIRFLEEFNILETSNFRTITQDNKDRFWFGSYGGGLIVYEPKQEPVNITTGEGLHDNTISQLAFDNEGNLWLGGNLGISFIEQNQIEQFLDENIEELRVSQLGVKEGMTIRETNGGFMPSSQLTPDGMLLIPTVQGVNVIDTNRMELNREVPHVFIEEVEIDGETFRPDQIKSIPYSAQRVIFRFSGLSFKNPRLNQYKYTLEGFDDDWIATGNNSEAIYSSMPHGNYALRVQASNNDGFWTTDAASVAFNVVPPFWQTTWFYFATILFLGILLAGAFKYRVRSIQKYSRQLQKMVDERTEELSISNQELKKHIDEKNKLQSILAHDLRNPFSAILGYIELIKNEFEQKEEQEHVEMMNMLLDSGRNTLALLENLLQWSNSKEGGLEINFEIIDVTQLVHEAVSMTDAQSTFKNIFVRNLINEPHYVWADRNMILSVLRNLISNAIKFSGRDSIVEISLEETNEKVILSIEDSGVGMAKQEQQKIFSSEGIQQKVGTQGEKGIGMGLMLCKEFIEKHDEKIWATSTPKKGSCFSFSLKKPLENQEKKMNKFTR